MTKTTARKPKKPSKATKKPKPAKASKATKPAKTAKTTKAAKTAQASKPVKPVKPTKPAKAVRTPRASKPAPPASPPQPEPKENAGHALCDAAMRGDLDTVKAALALGAGLEAKGYADFTALALAARDGHEHVVRYLLDQGAQVTSDALLVANMSSASTPRILGLLQLAQLRQVKPTVGGLSAPDAQLLQAAYSGDLAGLQAALQAGANPGASDGQDNAALRWAARWGHRDCVVALLDAGAGIDQESYTGWTALMEAVLAGHEDLAALLVERGADVNASTFAHASVLYFARDVVQYAQDVAGAQRIVALLEAHGAEYAEPRSDDD